jgi:hypothetical protein
MDENNEKKEEVTAGPGLSAGLGAATTHGGNFAALTGSPYTAELAWKLKAAESRISGLEDKLRLIGDFAHAGIRFAPMTPNDPS